MSSSTTKLLLTFAVLAAFGVLGAAFGADGVFAAGFEASFFASFTGPDGPENPLSAVLI